MKAHQKWIGLVALLATGLAGAKTAVLPVHRVNLSEGAAAAIGHVLATKYASVSGDETVTVERSAEASISDVADKAGAQEVLEATAVGLSTEASDKGRILLQVVRRDRSGGELYRAEMTAASMADIETVALRLAESLHHRKPVEATRTPRSVTRREAEAPNRMFTEKIMGLKTGFAGVVGSGGPYEPLLNFGFDGRLEADTYFLEFGAYFLLPSGTSDRKGYGGVGSELGASYYLGQGSVSPYVGGGVLPRLILSEDLGSPVNFAVYGQAGLMFARESSTRFYVDLRVAQNLSPVGREEGLLGGPGTRGHPTEIGLNVGIGW